MNNYIINTATPHVKGYFRACIYDFQRNTYDVVPKEFADFINLVSKKSISEIKRETSAELLHFIEEYLNFGIQKEYILKIPSVIDQLNFPKIKFEYKTPSFISNIILEIGNNLTSALENIKDILNKTNCFNIQIIIKSESELDNVEKYLYELANIGLRSIELIIPYSNDFDYNNLLEKNPNISFILIYSAPETKLLKSHYYGIQQIFCSNKKFKYRSDKNFEDLNVNITLFSESKKYNSYFNRKLYIDEEGNIKNTPESTEIFANIYHLKKTDDIIEIINNAEFQKYWYVHKEMIDICKHCEFRYMCVDNRIPIKRSEKEWYNETECNYNPYIAKWKNEEGYKTLNESGVVSNQNGFTINRKKVHEINEVLWE